MSVGLSSLYEEIKKHGVELACGENGLKNKIRWIQIVESIESAGFLQGNEFAFTTGLGIKNERDLLDLVAKANEKGASAIIVYIGKYIKNISSDLIDYCNTHNFPLFVAPWGVDMSNTMKDITINIIESEKKYTEVSNAIKDAIFLPEKTDLYLPVFRKLGYKTEWKYTISLIEIEAKDVKTYNVEDYTSYIISYIDEELSHIRSQYICVNMVNSIVILFYNKRYDEIKDIIKNIYIKIGKKFENFNFYIGVYKENIKIENMYKSYEESKKIARINKLLRNNNVKIRPNELGVYKLLLSIEDKEIIKSFYENTIGDLIVYDELNNTDYVDLLINYYENNCRINETANALYIHRNTVKYKIKKIEEILDVNFSDIGDKNKIYISLMIKQII